MGAKQATLCKGLSHYKNRSKLVKKFYEHDTDGTLAWLTEEQAKACIASCLELYEKDELVELNGIDKKDDVTGGKSDDEFVNDVYALMDAEKRGKITIGDFVTVLYGYDRVRRYPYSFEDYVMGHMPAAWLTTDSEFLSPEMTFGETKLERITMEQKAVSGSAKDAVNTYIAALKNTDKEFFRHKNIKKAYGSSNSTDRLCKVKDVKITKDIVAKKVAGCDAAEVELEFVATVEDEDIVISQIYCVVERLPTGQKGILAYTRCKDAKKDNKAVYDNLLNTLEVDTEFELKEQELDIQGYNVKFTMPSAWTVATGTTSSGGKSESYNDIKTPFDAYPGKDVIRFVKSDAMTKKEHEKLATKSYVKDVKSGIKCTVGKYKAEVMSYIQHDAEVIVYFLKDMKNDTGDPFTFMYTSRGKCSMNPIEEYVFGTLDLQKK